MMSSQNTALMLQLKDIDQIPEDNSPPVGKIYSNEEIVQQFGFKGDLAKWFCNREFTPDDPVVVLEYLPRFSNVHQGNFEMNKADIIQGLGNNNAMEQDDEGKVFFFREYSLMLSAHRAMKITHPWAFHSIPHRIANNVNAPDQMLPKILTTVIESCNRQSCVIQPYQFFMEQ